MPQPSAAPAGLASITDKLLHTIAEERAALGALKTQFARQLDALRTQAPLGDATHEANALLSRLDGLRQTRARQTRLLRRMLALDDAPGHDAPENGEADALALQPIAAALEGRGCAEAGRRLLSARAQVRQSAEAVQRQGRSLDHALRYAIGLGREMLGLLHETDADAPRATYTAAGQAAAAAPAHPLVNRSG